jgi:hypothetical protein
MSQRDLVAELRGARLEAPAELRARIRLVAADATPPRRRLTRSRALVVVVPLAAAAAVAGVLLTRPSHERRATPAQREQAVTTKRAAAPAAIQHGRSAGGAAATVVPPAPGRAQLYDATLGVQVAGPRAVSDGVKRALRITTSLSGYPTSVHANTQTRRASADLVLKIPRVHVQGAIDRFSQLGTITAEHVDVRDVQAGLNATDRTIARLQRRLKALRAETPVPKADIAALTARVAALQRRQADERRAAHYATVGLHLGTPPPPVHASHSHGPLHGVGVALTWLGIGALYAVAVGGPLVILALLVLLAVRLLRRRRDDALLSRS